MAHSFQYINVATRVNFAAGNKLQNRRVGAPGRCVVKCRAAKKDDDNDDNVDYGADWYAQTKKKGGIKRSSKEFYEEYRDANVKANNGRERKDLYTDNWDGDEYKGGGFNILTFLIILFLGVPALGLLFAYTSYGVLWG
eukprot:CAMPEP_0198206712 /NCGR_PEP_ID=MMETSP1445-20131203/10248_1 /TAXON_ID=36898 /ORGANISM="Pyramimonas sp., Strain CCMP2087" /LENGTH=138 /DNA_ID=CAMNT_0043879501 /DNA_START=56 /DNA_END=472 /DNA_ORIENTATION=-